MSPGLESLPTDLRDFSTHIVPCGLLGGLPKALLTPSQIDTNSAGRYLRLPLLPLRVC
ncbi:MAG: hypothetical protein ACFFCZ_25000 [Promethearchaeota archaeon]